VKGAVPLFALAVLMAGGVAVSGQSYSSTVSLPKVGEITTYNGAPEGFDPVSAADSQLEDYGYPRRPDPGDTKAYADWVKAVSTTRITPELSINPNVVHRPNQRVGAATAASNSNTVKTQSSNWSGYSLTAAGAPFREVVGLWVVPSINNQFRSFTGYESEWVGIDGNCNCNDLIQDGTEQDWTGGKPSYYAWIEFIPQPEVKINNFPVAPGDVIYAYASVGKKNGVVAGFYFIANYNTRKSVSASLNIPKNTKFSGLTAEWILERTQVNGSFSRPLPFYARAYMDDAYAYRSGSNRAINYTSEANENITMVEGSTPLSKAYVEDATSLWFQWLAYF
jgi:Peptidase A4 family